MAAPDATDLKPWVHLKSYEYGVEYGVSMEIMVVLAMAIGDVLVLNCLW